MIPKILVVDDEPDLELLIKQKFRKEIRDGKYNFVFAGNGVEALDKLNGDDEIELVLTDINMPEMDGLTLLKKIKELNNPLLHSVIVSAYGDILNIRTAMNGGAFDFVVKPIDLNDLEITIDKAVTNLDTLKKALDARDELVLVQNELKEARDLQLSMLPKSEPKSDKYEFAFHMQTASEVGGDYYDYSVSNDGTLSVVIGDATGHGMPAGTMVSVMKGLFISKSHQMTLEEFFSNSNRTIKHIDFKRMMMAFSTVKINGEKINYLNAGMPSLYIYKDKLDEVIEIESNNMPLGAISATNFSSMDIEVESGDTLLLLSDGFPEIKNSNHEMYGYERLINKFKSIGNQSAKEIVVELKNESNEWSNNQDPDDDITFVVIKVK
jgi:sigma-B regulation protein RsbU (phosphoserine phosphatase)